MRQVIYAKSPQKLRWPVQVSQRSLVCVFAHFEESCLSHSGVYVSCCCANCLRCLRARLPSFLIGCCSSSCAVGLTPDAVSLMNSTLNADVQPLVPPDCFCVRWHQSTPPKKTMLNEMTTVQQQLRVVLFKWCTLIEKRVKPWFSGAQIEPSWLDPSLRSWGNHRTYGVFYECRNAAKVEYLPDVQCCPATDQK